MKTSTGLALVIAALAAHVGSGAADMATMFPTESVIISGLTDDGQMDARLLFRFDWTQVPVGVAITQAYLYLDGITYVPEEGSVCAYVAPVMAQWNADATWDGPQPGSEWTSPGGDCSYPLGDYDCLTPEIDRALRLNMTNVVMAQLAGAEKQNGFILFLIEPDVTAQDADVSTEVMRQVKPRLELQYHDQSPSDGVGRPAESETQREMR
ncbi:hypothetical protein JXA88_11095 [Candidatus Fermentibacteria bacterium]|nr:hypothetical protein [Candidatus Fermentibacteria bacterium]